MDICFFLFTLYVLETNQPQQINGMATPVKVIHYDSLSNSPFVSFMRGSDKTCDLYPRSSHSTSQKWDSICHFRFLGSTLYLLHLGHSLLEDHILECHCFPSRRFFARGSSFSSFMLREVDPYLFCPVRHLSSARRTRLFYASRGRPLCNIISPLAFNFALEGVVSSFEVLIYIFTPEVTDSLPRDACLIFTHDEADSLP